METIELPDSDSIHICSDQRCNHSQMKIYEIIINCWKTEFNVMTNMQKYVKYLLDPK